MDNEEKKKFIERCNEAYDLAERVIRSRFENIAEECSHPTFNKIFELAYKTLEAKNENWNSR